jgi:hypothetical protein
VVVQVKVVGQARLKVNRSCRFAATVVLRKVGAARRVSLTLRLVGNPVRAGLPRTYTVPVKRR